jgi:hypothetical protein
VGLLDPLQDRRRLGQDCPVIEFQRWHTRLRVDRPVVRLQMFPAIAYQMHLVTLIDQPFQVERDTPR